MDVIVEEQLVGMKETSLGSCQEDDVKMKQRGEMHASEDALMDDFTTLYLERAVEAFGEELESIQANVDSNPGKKPIPTAVMLQALSSINPTLWSSTDRRVFMKSARHT